MSEKLKADQDELLDDLRTVISDTETMLKDVTQAGGAEAQALRDKIVANLSAAKTKLIEAEKLVADKARVAAKATDEYVHENPWTSVGVAAGVGFLLGLLVSRR
ncbi:DUF883 family protein [Chitiniphilus eburneus]|uniref:DUF883 domain-containing protein n=1 Tax=Chitiniphilus eburneus TaxID=2571148 RepID=A0A4U0QS19_9NEIS|nr:DUF883 family protein [Chitiniphilus eburneus]TJZ79034.1 DUF883 domain-containing protein [Chitiniphilus eburneus]